ncbi:MAG: site-2 protease family protein [Nitrospirota bacterium]|nr:site-2 protease family protein [Nitrospirota bacterium]MDP2383976.1 site-2 protease family protein [Nitrospirota bacterium]
MVASIPDPAGDAELTLEISRCYGGHMTLSNWKIGRALGIPIHVHASWFVVFFFVTWSLATGYLPETLPGLSAPRYWGMGGIAALLLFLSVLLHELGHSYVALRYQIPIRQITLFIFGGMAHMGKEPPTPRAEFLIAMAGPLVSLILGVGCLGGAMATDALFAGSGLQGLVVLGGLLGMVNVQLGLFNLIPGFPLDGGRVLRAGLWAWSKDFDRATGQAALTGIGFGVAIGLIGAVLMVGTWFGAWEDSIATDGGWLIFIGAFLFSAALASRRQATIRVSLSSVRIRQVMVHPVVQVPPDMTLQDAVDQYFVAHGFSGFPVCEEGQVLGVVTVGDVQAVSTALWPWRRVRDIMSPVSPSFCIPPDWSVMQAMERMAQGGWDRLVVMEHGAIVGLITRSAIAQFLELHRA